MKKKSKNGFTTSSKESLTPDQLRNDVAAKKAKQKTSAEPALRYMELPEDTPSKETKPRDTKLVAGSEGTKMHNKVTDDIKKEASKKRILKSSKDLSKGTGFVAGKFFIDEYDRPLTNDTKFQSEYLPEKGLLWEEKMPTAPAPPGRTYYYDHREQEKEKKFIFIPKKRSFIKRVVSRVSKALDNLLS